MIKKRHKKFNKTHFFPSLRPYLARFAHEIPWHFLIASGTGTHMWNFPSQNCQNHLLISFVTFHFVVYELQRNFQENKNPPCDVLRSFYFAGVLVLVLVLRSGRRLSTKIYSEKPFSSPLSGKKSSIVVVAGEDMKKMIKVLYNFLAWVERVEASKRDRVKVQWTAAARSSHIWKCTFFNCFSFLSLSPFFVLLL